MNTNIIQEPNIKDYPKPITAESTEIILEQMKKTICKIDMGNGNKGTGFFCKILCPVEGNLKSFLVTNNHVIDESHLGKDKKMILL